MDIKRIIEWVRSHRWETSTGVLSLSLVVIVVLFVLAVTGEDAESDAAVSTTTAPRQSTMPSDTTAPDQSGGAPPVSGAGPFGESSLVAVTAVIVDNVAEAGLQIGIDAAELLIEVPVEGGLTRFIALYGGELPNLVGPVRSLRPASADLLAPFQPVVFTTGGQPFVTGAVMAVGATVVTPDVSIAFQSLERPQPHHVFASPLAEAHLGTEVGASWAYGDWPGGDTATEVTIPLSGGITWRYEDGVYVRYEAGEIHEVLPDFDADPETLTRDTLILLVAHQKSAGYTDSAGAEVPTFDVIGGGDLYVMHDGELIEGTWYRPNQADGYTFTAGDGGLLSIPLGDLYLAIVPDGLFLELGS